MIRTKLFMALALTGFGAAAIGINASLPGPAPLRLPPPAEAISAPIALRVIELPQANPEITLEPVTIFSRLSTRRTAAVAQELVPCSDWRAMASGPSARGVRELCVPGSRLR